MSSTPTRPRPGLSPSGHTDTFARDHLPPAEQWPEFLTDLPELRYPERLNCASALLDEVVAAHGPDRPCLRTDDETWTYGQLLARANQLAHLLSGELGVVPGQRVLLRGPNNPWLVACWCAVLKAGGVAVTTVPLLRTHELDQLVQLTWPDGRRASLRRLVCDLIEEYGRHTGHADLIREAVDGRVGEDPPQDWRPPTRTVPGRG